MSTAIGSSLKGKKVLVTGATGFIGANLVKRLVSLGANVRGTLHVSPAVIKDPSIEYVQADLMKAEDCQKAVEGVDYVFMCSANTSGAAVMASTPLVHVTPNIIMNAQLMEAAYFAKVKKFCFMSSSAAYPPSDERKVQEKELLDGDPYEAYYSVGWMKRYSEVLCKMYSQKLKNPMPMTVIRPSNVFGPLDDFDFKTSHMMAALIRRVVERHAPMEVWGTGDDIKDMIFIDDFLDGTLAAFEKTKDYLAINIASGQGYSVKQVLSTILEVDGYNDADVRYDPSKPTMIPIRLIDTTLAKELLGFEAKTPLHEGIRKTIEWYKKEQGK